MTIDDAQVLSRYLIELPYTLGRLVASVAAPPGFDGDALASVWEPSEHEREIGGRAAALVLQRYYPQLVEHLPAVVLGSVLVGGLGGRALVTRRLFAEAREERARIARERATKVTTPRTGAEPPPDAA